MQISSSGAFFRAAAPLLLAIFIDGMGLGLLFPILNTLFMSTHGGFFQHPIAEGTRHFLFGLTISIFMLCWFFGAAYLGDLSDALGRRKTLLISLVGSALGYGVSAIAVGFHSVIMLIIGRMIAGFTSGSQSIAQAAIIDISRPDLKTRNIGFIMLASSLGFIFGPLCGAFFSDSDFVHWFNFTTPFYFASFVSILNALLVYWLFSETFIAKRAVHWQFHRAIEIFVSAFKNEKVKHLSVILFVMVLAWSSYYAFISMYLTERYYFNTQDVGMFMAAMSMGFGIGFGWLVNVFAHRYALKSSIVWTLILSGLFVGITAMAKHALFPFVVSIPLGIVVAIAYSMLLTLFSNQVDETMQGWVMGITGSIMAMAFAITGITSSVLADWNVTLPMWFSALFFLMSAGLMLKLRLSKK